MHHTKSLVDFIRLNDSELRRLVGFFYHKYHLQSYNALSLNDIVQDVYVKFHVGNILGEFDPDYGVVKKTNLGTYLYTVVRNVIRSYLKTNEFKLKRHSSWNPINTDYEEDIDIILQYNDLAMNFPTYQMDDDPDIDKLSAQIRDFENFLSNNNKYYRLTKRKDKTCGTKGCSLSEVFELFKEGLSGKEIAKIYGVSNMFVSNMKREIIDIMGIYGINYDFPKRKNSSSKFIIRLP